MFSSKRMVALTISCVFVVQILTSTVFNKIGFSDVQAASTDDAYETLLQSLEESNESTQIGDVDGNGQINSIDFARMRMRLLGMIKSFPVSNGTWAADVTGDGVFNSIDFAFMRMYILGKIKKFPAEENEVTPTPSISATPTPSISATPTPSISITPTPSISATPTPSISVTPTPSISETPTPSISATPTPSISATPTPSNSTEPTPTDVGPSKPTGLECSLISGTSALIYWEPSTDGIKYAVFKNDNYEAIIDEEEYTFTNLIPGETYEFKVCAIDEEYEQSEFSDICIVETNINTMDEIKIALVNNFDNMGTNYTLTYKGEFEEFKTKISQVISEAVNESSKPFMLLNQSWGAKGSVGDLQITFDFVYDNQNNYTTVARSIDGLKEVLLCELNNRTENIGIIYKGSITQNDFTLVCEEVFNCDTYLKACIESYTSTISTNNSFEISALTLNCSYITTKEQEVYVDKTVEFIVSKLTNADMSYDEKEKLIHDYIMTNVDYCEGEKYGSAYSALYEGKAKCDGYAMLTYKMLKVAGIDNIIVTNEDHAWNIVKINENWYHLDTTWDDAKKKDFGFYKYYNLTDDEILETRNYDNVYGKECTSNYIDDLTERNDYSDGKYDEILKEIKKNDNYYFINSFNRNASLDLLYNEMVLKEGESISLIDEKISPELYEGLYQWSTSDTDVATVSNGIITAKKAGTIVISAQPMYDMLSTVSLFCRVHVIPVDLEDGKTPQVLSQENINDLTDLDAQLQLTINSEDDINSTTTVTKAEDWLEGKVWSVVEPVDISSTSEFDWAEIGFKLTKEQLEVYDINDLVIYWYDEKTGTIVHQATMVDEESGVISATVNHFSTYGVTTRKLSDLTTTIAFVIDSKYSDQTSLDIYKENIHNTINGLRKESNVRVIFIDAKTNESIYYFFVPSEGAYLNFSVSTSNRIDSAFDKITPGEKTPTNDEIMATVNSGMTNGNGEVKNINVSGHKDNKYILFYTKWDARFVDNNDVVIKMGDTIGAVIGKTVEYYAGGPISYDETDVNPLVEFLLEGNYTQLGSDTEKMPWKLSQDGSNVKDDVIVLQKILVSLGLLEMPIDSSTGKCVPFGTYGSLTKTAVEKFQQNNGLHLDGIVGKNTWNKMMLPWDEENAQPDRNTWSYRYIIQNNMFFSEKPEVTLTGSYDETQLEVGNSIKITAKGSNCHHLALFINGEWVKTAYGETNTNVINLEYDYKIPAVGFYTIQVKGRNIPGNGGELVSSEIVEIEGIMTLAKYYPLDFNGSNSVNLGSEDKLKPKSEITISMWVKPSSTQNSDATIISCEGEKSGYEIRQDGNNTNKYVISYWNESGRELRTVNVPLQANCWQHIAVKKPIDDGTRSPLFFYVDGECIETEPQYGDISYDDNCKVYLGTCASSPGSRNFKGSLDDVAIWNRALSIEEIQEIRNNGPESNINKLITLIKNDSSGQLIDTRNCNLDFNGNYQVNLGASNRSISDNAMTISMWVRPLSSKTSNANIISCEGNETGYAIEQDGKTSDDYVFKYWDGSDWEKTGSIELNAGSWQHLAVTKSEDGDIKFILNGGQEIKYSYRTMLWDNTNLYLGTGANNLGNENFKGSMHQVGIWNRALTLEEIKKVMENGPETKLYGLQQVCKSTTNFIKNEVEIIDFVAKDMSFEHLSEIDVIDGNTISITGGYLRNADGSDFKYTYSFPLKVRFIDGLYYAADEELTNTIFKYMNEKSSRGVYFKEFLLGGEEYIYSTACNPQYANMLLDSGDIITKEEFINMMGPQWEFQFADTTRNIDMIDVVHMMLDVGGMIPVVGGIFDGTNAVIYFIEADALNGCLSMLGTIDLIQYGCAGLKLTTKTLKTADNMMLGKNSLMLAVDSIGLIKAGSINMLDDIACITKTQNGYEFVSKNGIVFKMLDDEIPAVAKSTIKAMADSTDEIMTCLKTEPEALFEVVEETKELDNSVLYKLRDNTEIEIFKADLTPEQIICSVDGCFTGDTLVTTKDGLKRIDEITEGEYVLSKDVKTGEIAYKKVDYVYIKNTKNLVQLVVSGEEIKTTSSHLFFTASGWWKTAKNIKVGDKVLTAEGEFKEVTATKVVELEEGVRIYNLNVDEFHTYFVGTQGLLVHNNCIDVVNDIDNWLTSLTVEEVNALKSYKGAGYLEINAALRNGTVNQYQQVINNIKSAVSKGVIKENLTLYRGLTESGIVENWDKLLNGIEYKYTDKAFSSTTTSKDVAEFFAMDHGVDGIVAEIINTKGLNAANIDSLNAGILEDEFLLQSGLSFEVKKAWEEFGVKHVLLEVVY